MTGRKTLLRDYKDRKVEAGIYLVRCAPTGEAWVGATPDLSTRQSGVWFTLRCGSHNDRALQAAWTAHGEGAFVFEALEAIDDEGRGDLGRASLLKERRDAWIARLSARKLNR